MASLCEVFAYMFRGLRNRWQATDEERLSSSSRARKRGEEQSEPESRARRGDEREEEERVLRRQEGEGEPLGQGATDSTDCQR